MTKKINAARRLSASPFLCVLLLTAAPLGVVAQAQERAPRFEDYPVREVYRGSNARGRFRQIYFVHKLPHEEGEER
ncbi:MAG TPA: hypothetical protein VGP08_00415 [Pyrinomonadaceae bacterium]|jgi:hypothetical protein|nr:hypothetical protein [Pyrinomonadaceae bacterium]